MTQPIDGRDVLAETTLCKEPSYACLERKCKECGPNLLLEQILQNLKDDMTRGVEWEVWEYVDHDGKGKRKEKRPRQGTLDEFISYVKKLVHPLAKHIFVGRWQYGQMRTILAKMQKNVAVCTFDFAENYVCKWQDEVQSAYWGYSQVTLHPVVCHYRCQDLECDEDVLDFEVFLSDDSSKDANMVQLIVEKVVTHLQVLWTLEKVKRKLIYL